MKLAEIHDQSIEFVRARYLEQLNRLQLPKEGARLPVEVSNISGLRRIGQLEQRQSVLLFDGRDHRFERAIGRGLVRGSGLPPPRRRIHAFRELEACRRSQRASLGRERDRRVRGPGLLRRRGPGREDERGHHGPQQLSEANGLSKVTVCQAGSSDSP